MSKVFDTYIDKKGRKRSMGCAHDVYRGKDGVRCRKCGKLKGPRPRRAKTVARHHPAVDRARVLPANPKDILGAQKPDLSLVPGVAGHHEALAFENGATKYGPYNWREKAVEARTYVAAALRHIHDWLDREEFASDSGVHNLAHARACLAILLDAQEQGNLIDNRPKKGKSAEVLERLKEWKRERAKTRPSK